MGMERHSLWLIPRLHLGKERCVFSFRHVSPQVCFGLKPHVAAVASTLVDLPPDEIDQFHLLIEIES